MKLDEQRAFDQSRGEAVFDHVSLSHWYMLRDSASAIDLRCHPVGMIGETWTTITLQALQSMCRYLTRLRLGPQKQAIEMETLCRINSHYHVITYMLVPSDPAASNATPAIGRDLQRYLSQV